MENICAAAMAFFANAHKGDMRIDSGIDSAESTVSIYAEEQSSVNSLSESVLTSSLSISNMAQSNILSNSQNEAVNTDTSTQSNYDTYINTPNSSNYYDIPYTSSNDSNSSSRSSSSNSSRRGSRSSSAVSNSSSSEGLESSSVADSSSNSEYLDADFFAIFHYYIDDDGIVLTGYAGDDIQKRCSSLEKVGFLSNSLENIGTGAFRFCNNFSEISGLDDLKWVGSEAFKKTAWLAAKE